MTPQEQQLIDSFLTRLAAVRGVAKDPQAEALIQQRLAEQPDALYLLVQRSLLLDHALENAKAQIAQLQAQQQGGASFLGDHGWGNPGASVPPPAPGMPPPMPQAAPPSWRERWFGGAAAGAPPMAPAQPSFLASAATTAAGVAGGMFLFNGIESLLGGHQGGGLFGGGQQETVVENITNNNTFLDQGNGGFAQNPGYNDASFNDSGDGGFNDDLAGGDSFGGFDDDSSWS
jgi:hypothetical protein